MWSTGLIAAFSLICATFLESSTAFVPSRTSLTRGASYATGHRAVAVSKPASVSRRSNGGLSMVDQDVLMAGGVALAGIVVGAGLVAFTEQQGERTAERGSISDTTKQRMSAMFMEDDEMPGADVDDVRSRMRAALRANQSADELEQMTAKARAKAIEEADDGW